MKSNEYFLTGSFYDEYKNIHKVRCSSIKITRDSIVLNAFTETGGKVDIVVAKENFLTLEYLG
jgi:hypothetical protein